jgi:pimeloyl-ACP methyl ester carboxylesterase
MNTYILHGWAVDPNNEKKWAPLRLRLSQVGVRTKFLAIPGLTSPLDEVWTLNDYQKWLEKELKGQERVVLIGHSFGGHLAIRYAAKHADQLKKLVLIDASGMRSRTLKARIKRSVFLTAAKIGRVFTRSESVRDMIYKLAREKDYQQASPTLRKTMTNILNDEIVDDLPQVKSETLIVWGENDRATPLSHGKFYATQIPESKLKIISGARHSPQFTHPTQVAKIVAEFIKNKG